MFDTNLIHWPTAFLVIANLILLRRASTSLWKLSILALPGTLCHELLHLVTGILALARPASFSIWPRREGNAYTLGSVSFKGVNVLNGVFVALAPLVLLLPTYLGYTMAGDAWQSGGYMAWAMWGTLAANLLYAALPSSADILLGLSSMLFYSALGGAAWWIRDAGLFAA